MPYPSIVLLSLLLAACAGPTPRPAAPSRPAVVAKPAAPAPKPAPIPAPQAAAAQDIVMYSLMLYETGYRFGGKNPEAGLDCSGLVTHVYAKAAGMQLKGSAAMLAGQGRSVSASQLRPGDLVFFNTRGPRFSHVGIYLGEQKFIHALSSTAGVRIDKLTQPYFAKRFEGGRTFFS